MPKVTINGKTYEGRSSVVVNNNKVIIDGVEVGGDDLKHIDIHIEGDLNSLRVDACEQVTVKGSVGSVQTASGNVHCGDVEGSVSTVSGDISCKSVKGNASTISGDIHQR